MALPMRVNRGNSPVDLFHSELDSMLGRFFGGGDGGYGSGANFCVDIREDEDNIFVEADLPGFRKEDVEITLENGMLTITADRREIEGENKQDSGSSERPWRRQRGNGSQENYLLQERRSQRFVRSFTMPSNVAEQDVEAKRDNGVLIITLKKREEAKPRRISVT
jgi:HSP20 family protein